MQTIIINMDICNRNNKMYGVNEKGGNTGKELTKGRGIKERNEIEKKKELDSTDEISKQNVYAFLL